MAAAQLADPGAARIEAAAVLYTDRPPWAVTRRRLPSCPGCGRTVVRGHPDHDGTACEECCSICAEDVGWLSGWLVPSPRAVEWGT